MISSGAMAATISVCWVFWAKTVSVSPGRASSLSAAFLPMTTFPAGNEPRSIALPLTSLRPPKASSLAGSIPVSVNEGSCSSVRSLIVGTGTARMGMVPAISGLPTSFWSRSATICCVKKESPTEDESALAPVDCTTTSSTWPVRS